MSTLKWCCLLLLPVVFLLAHLTFAGSFEFPVVEHFTTTTNRDAAKTTAWWDTQDGMLKLPQFPLTAIGSYSTYTALRVAIAGDYAYLADGTTGLVIFDISDPAHPTATGSYNTPGQARNIVVEGDYAFIADEGGSLCIVNINNPSSPALAGGYTTGDFVYGVDVAGDYAFLASYGLGLIILDIKNPASPSFIGKYDTPGLAMEVDVVGDYAFVADHTNGLVVIDISNPAAPSLAGHYDAASESWDVVVSGNYAYIGAWEAGFLVIDVSDPTNPTYAGGYDSPGEAWDIDVEGDFAYVADNTAYRFLVMDISDPTQARLVQTCSTSDIVRGINVEGEHAYVADDWGGLKVVKIAQRVSPPLYTALYTTAGGSGDFTIDGDHAFVTNGYGFRIVDISDPTNPVQVGSYDAFDNVSGVDVDGDFLFLANNYMHLRIFDISDLTNPVEIGVVPGTIADYANAVRVAGDYAYVIEWPDGLRIVDIKNPASPTLIGSYDTPNQATHLEVTGNHVILGQWNLGFRIIDVSNPASPVQVSYYDTPGNASGLAVEGNLLYVADGNAALEVFDISNPASPTMIGMNETWDYLDSYTGVDVVGDYAFVSNFNFGMYVFDVSDPTNPAYIESYTTSHRCADVEVHGDFAYLATTSEGLEVVQVFQRTVDPSKNKAQSVLMPQAELITELRLETKQTDEIQWEVTADGVNWQSMTPGPNLHPLAHPGTALAWRATLNHTRGGVYPTCDSLRLSTDQQPAVFITSFAAVEGQGGVELSWDAGADEPIMGFNVYRRTDGIENNERLNANGLLSPDDRRFVDETVRGGPVYWYTLGVVKEDGSELLSGTIRASARVRALALYQNHPNPFNPTTAISFTLPERTAVELSIYDARGRLVRSLVDGPLDEGLNEYTWDGRDAAGLPVSTGVYFSRLKAGKHVLTKKMVLTK
jgi:hypothetical protein